MLRSKKVNRQEYFNNEGHHIREDEHDPTLDCEHDYKPIFQGGDTFQCSKCSKCSKEIDMTED